VGRPGGPYKSFSKERVRVRAIGCHPSAEHDPPTTCSIYLLMVSKLVRCAESI
jgi:hypothetical protein